MRREHEDIGRGHEPRRVGAEPQHPQAVAETEAPVKLAELGLELAVTDREHDVLRLIAGGATNAEIADALHVSGGTVKSHVGSIFSKLGVRDRAAAIVYAYQYGIASPLGPP